MRFLVGHSGIYCCACYTANGETFHGARPAYMYADWVLREC